MRHYPMFRINFLKSLAAFALVIVSFNSSAGEVDAKT